MKTLLTILTLAAALVFPTGCSYLTPGNVTNAATQTGAAVSLLPKGLVTDVQKLVAKHPGAKKYLVTVANSLDSIVTFEGKLPSPDSTTYAMLMWTEMLPEVGSYVSDFDRLYRLYFASIAPTGAALAELAEVVRAGTVAP